jgi:hypothetical protein
MRRVLGWLMLAAVFGGLFAAVVVAKGWMLAAFAFGVAIALTAIIYVAVEWIVG